MFRVMQLGMLCSSLMASWACYAITMGAIASPEIIKEVR